MSCLVRRLLLVVLATFAVAAGSQERGRPSEMVYLHGSALQLHRALAPSDLAALPVDRQETFEQARGAPGQQPRPVARGPLLSTGDLRPGARHVRNVVRVEVRGIGD